MANTERKIMKSRKIPDYEFEQMFDEMLDESYPWTTIGYSEFSASEILKNCDPIAYRTRKNDFADTLSKDGYVIEGYE